MSVSGCGVSPLSAHFFFFNDTATTEIYTLSLHDALPIFHRANRGTAGHCIWHLWRRPNGRSHQRDPAARLFRNRSERSEEHTSELQSLRHLVWRLLLGKRKKWRDR